MLIQSTDPITVEAFLSLVAGGLSWAIVTWFISWAFEESAKWQALSSKIKQAVIAILSIAIGMLAVWAQSLSPDVLDAIRPYAGVILAAMSTWLASQVAYRNRKPE